MLRHYASASGTGGKKTGTVLQPGAAGRQTSRRVSKRQRDILLYNNDDTADRRAESVQRVSYRRPSRAGTPRTLILRQTQHADYFS